MEIYFKFPSLKRIIHSFRILVSVTKRSLIVDFRYKFNIFVEMTWTAVNVAVFVLLGAAWQETAETTGVPYTMVTFFIIATGFFTVISGVMESTVTAISEENQLGTMGFLITNSVSPIAIILGRYLAATVKWLLIMVVIVIPPLIIKGITPSTFGLFLAALVVFFISWLFILGFTLLLTSIALIFKKTTVFNRVMIYVVRFIGGAFVPLVSFDNSLSFLTKPLSNYLIWFPPAYTLESLRWLFTVDSIEAVNCATCISKDEIQYGSFDSIFGTTTTNFLFGDPMVQKMLMIVGIFFVVCLFLVGRLTRMARKMGTIEFY